MPVFLFFGEDIYSHREKLSFWQKEFEKKYGDINISIFQGKETSANELSQACLAAPFLAEKRFVVIKDFLAEAEDAERAKAAKLAENIPESCVLVFSESGQADRRTALFKKIQKIGKTMEFTPPSGSKLLAWIERKIKNLEGQIEREAAIYLSEVVPNDLFALENEISKLVNYANGRPITKQDIELLTNSQFSASIFRLTDGIGQKNVKVSLETLHQLIDSGEELHRILYMIMRQFRIIISVKDLASKGLKRDEITAKLREHPFVISNTMTQLKNFSIEQLKRAYELLIEIDSKLKSGGIKILAGDNREFVLALDRLVLDLC